MDARKIIKSRLQQDSATFYGFDQERANIKGLFSRIAIEGESNSALLIGPKNGGKTTLINSVLFELLHEKLFVSNTIIVSLNGLVHTDDRQALKSITNQMNLVKAVEGKVFASFSENLTFLLSCLKTGADAQRLIFIIEEFDLFCAHQNQTLLYNLFDVAQSAQTPICVLGITCRLDVVELLEKRVKSRFSHRQIFLLPEGDDFDEYLELVRTLLKLPTAEELKENHLPLSNTTLKHLQLPFLRRIFNPTGIELPKKYVSEWNSKVEQLVNDENAQKSLLRLYNNDVSIASLKRFLFQLACSLSEVHPFITSVDVTKLTEHLLSDDDKVKLITGLSVLEICLLIAIKHHCEIYDNDPFNFEIILTRYNKFTIKSSSMQNIDREVALKGFENLKYQEFITAIGTEGKVQKEYQMHKMLLFPDHIDRAVAKYQNLPTEIEQWAKSSII